jgi:hypothetical protein
VRISAAKRLRDAAERAARHAAADRVGIEHLPRVRDAALQPEPA